MRVLVVEDERDLREILVKRLKEEAYSVDACNDGEEALSYIEMGEYDIVLLDIMLPKVTGLEVVARMRREKNSTPVLLLTAKDTIEDRVIGLDSGADDYLVKPFAFEELLARIRVLTRRKTEETTNLLSVCNLTMDRRKREVKRDESEIELSSREFALLEYLMLNKGIVLSRDKIEQHIWNFDYEGGSNIIDVYIRYLRRKIDKDYEPKLIHTVRGAGYVLKEEAK